PLQEMKLPRGPSGPQGSGQVLFSVWQFRAFLRERLSDTCRKRRPACLMAVCGTEEIRQKVYGEKKELLKLHPALAEGGRFRGLALRFEHDTRNLFLPGTAPDTGIGGDNIVRNRQGQSFLGSILLPPNVRIALRSGQTPTPRSYARPESGS